ncbi:hypothetical protein RI129_000455 [Pyrocoelia pectoralis]|uniref:Odorant receptor n=1 Tax=Pyrocoelia pectoralis TaxID=417401 RepID=A0AAN7VSC2_9COLE
MGELDLLKFNVQYATLCSIFSPNTNNALILTLSHLYKFCNLCILYMIWLPFFYELYLAENLKITDYSLTVMNIGCYVCSILTLHFFIHNGKNGRRLIEHLNRVFKYRADRGIVEISMEETDENTKKITRAFLSLLTAGVLSMTAIPILMKGRILPLPGMYPGLDTKNNTFHYIEVYTLQAVGQIVVAQITASSDTLFICTLLVTSQQLTVLGADICNCLYNALLYHGVTQEEVLQLKETFEGTKHSKWSSEGKPIESNRIMEIINSQGFKIRLVQLLTKYIKHHQEILYFCEKIESYFLPLIFMKVCISMFYHVFITFALLHSTEIGLVLTLIQYETCAITELLVFAFAGQTLIDKSEKLHQDVFESPWYVCDVKYQKYILMILMRTGRTTKISVGKLATMSLPTFLLIMKTALSYLAVLRQVTDTTV